MGFRLLRGLLFLAVAVRLIAAAGNPHVYRNEEFGITLPFPAGTTACLTPSDEHDHGPAFLLGTSDTEICKDLSRIERSRHIVIFAGYNAVDATKRLPELLKWACAGTARAPCRVVSDGLRIAGLRSAAARVDYPDGSIDIIVVTQAGKPDPAFDASVPSINYALSLHTSAGHLAEDLRAFRAVLATIRLSPTVQ